MKILSKKKLMKKAGCFGKFFLKKTLSYSIFKKNIYFIYFLYNLKQLFIVIILLIIIINCVRILLVNFNKI